VSGIRPVYSVSDVPGLYRAPTLPPSGLNYDSKRLTPFNPRKFALNRSPIASNWPRTTPNYAVFVLNRLVRRLLVFGFPSSQKLAARRFFYSTFSSPLFQWRKRTMYHPNLCGTAALGCGCAGTEARRADSPRGSPAGLPSRVASARKKRHPAKRRVSSVSDSSSPSFSRTVIANPVRSAEGPRAV
jgi:hypothetical protein